MQRFRSISFAAGLLLATCSSAVHAQQNFQLVNSTTGDRATARLTAQALEITNQAGTSRFVRDAANDTVGYTAYSSAALRQTIRWPTTNTGTFLVGERIGFSTTWRAGKSQITRTQVTNRPTIPASTATFNLQGTGSDRGTATITPQNLVFVLTTQNVTKTYQYARNPLLDTVGFTAYEARSSLGVREIIRWPISNQGQYQVQTGTNASSFSPFQIVANQVVNRPTVPTSTSTFNLKGAGNDRGTATVSPQEIAFVLTTRGGSSSSKYVRNRLFDSAGYSAYESFSSQGIRELVLWPNNNQGQYQVQSGTGQPFFSPFRIVASTTGIPVANTPRRVSRKVVAKPPLEPAVVELFNSHNDELWVLVHDSRNPTMPTRLKIPSKQSKTIKLERDAGSSVVEIWETPITGGLPTREERVTDQPAKKYYDISVYELIVQSIAIDRSRPGRAKVEDINRSPKSVGKIDVPAGAAMTSGKTDIYAVAKQQLNSGAVRRIDPAKWRTQSSTSNDPFQRILRQTGN